MNFIHAENPDAGAHALSTRLIFALLEGKKTLWLVPGGSNIATAVSVMSAVRKKVPVIALSNLTVSLSDERYGPVGHADSNWRQLKEAGFIFEDISVIPVLRDLSLEETVEQYGSEIMAAFERSAVRIAQLGIGPDGHIAGILPHSPAVFERGPVSGYQAEKFTRVTLSTDMLGRLSAAFVFAFGDSKAQALKSLRDRELPLEAQPAQILKQIPEAYLYSDRV